MLRDKINYNELKLLGEYPLLFKLRIRKLFGKRVEHYGGILIINNCIIGDFVGTLPALKLFIEKQEPYIDMVVIPPLKSLAESIRGIRRVFTAKSIYQRGYELENTREDIPNYYNYIVVLRISPDSYNMLKTIKYSKLDIHDFHFLKYTFHVLKSILLKKDFKQWRDINFDILGINKPAQRIDIDDIFELNESDYSMIRNIPEMKENGKNILIHTGSGWNVKLWDNNKWIELLRKINKEGDFKFIFIGGGKTEQESFDYIRDNLDFKIYSLINKADVRTVLLIMRISDYFIGIDSGPRNLAHLADLRSISLLGPAPRNFMPLNSKDIVINKFNCRCKSLFYLHRESALQKLSADEVFAGFMKLTAQD